MRKSIVALCILAEYLATILIFWGSIFLNHIIVYRWELWQILEEPFFYMLIFLLILVLILHLLIYYIDKIRRKRP